MICVAVAGAIPEGTPYVDDLIRQLEQIKGCMTSKGLNARPELIVSPAYASPEWRKWISEAGCQVTGVGSEEELWEDVFDRRVLVDTALRETLGGMICNRADLLLAIWNEDVRELDGATWEILRIALEKRLPCVWISSRTGRLYWQEKTVYDTYEPGRIERIISQLSAGAPEPVEGQAPSLLLRAGAWLYKKFLGKYRATRVNMKATDDVLLREDFRFGPEASGAEACRRRLLERYHVFDRTAVQCNDLYQAALYWRAVIPLITSLFVALGFYAKDVLAALLMGTKTTWGIVAGVAFLIHGFLNLYVFMLSRSRKIREYQRGMVQNRRMAELLRISIHFVPFGFWPDLRRLCGEDPALYAALRQILREAEADAPLQREIGRGNTVEAFQHVGELLSDQIAYHSISGERYSQVAEHLERWSNAVFYIGFGFILFRAGLKFVMSFDIPFPNIRLNNGIMLRDCVSSAANMLALLFPAWYSFFSTKLSLCNFRFNRDNHRRMLALLTDEQDNFEHMRSSIDVVPVEALISMCDSLAEIMTAKDTFGWARQYEGTHISHL